MRGSVTIPVGGTVTVVLNVTATVAGGYTNTVTLTPLAGVTNLGSPTATAPGTVTNAVTPSLTKTVGSTTVAAGGTTSYTIVIGNAGPNVMTTASVVDTLPAGVTASAAGINTTFGGGASAPTAFTASGTSVCRLGDHSGQRDGDGGDPGDGHGGGHLTNTVTLTPLAGVVNLGSHDRHGGHHRDNASHAQS